MVPSTFRSDIIIQRQFFRQKEYYVLKDPLALTYFRLKREEAFLLTLLDGRRSLGEIRGLYLDAFPNRPQSLSEIYAFIREIGHSGLLNISARRFVDYASGSNTPKPTFLQLWGKLMAKMIFFKVPLLDPSPWLGSLTRALSFVWTKPFVTSALAFFTWTIFWLCINRGAFTQNTISFFAPSNLFLLWLCIIGVKTLHELGHATTCRHFGGEVHEMGVCLICFTPCGYVDASDAYMMRQRRHSLYTTLAGIFTEFMVASIAAHFWLYLPDGLTRNIMFNIMIVASVNTVFFNMNPLMRFDGYYVAADLLQIPNLRAKAITYCSLRLQKFFFGIRNRLQERFVEGDTHGTVFVVYAVCAYFYMLFIIYSIGQIFSRVLEPAGLKPLGMALGISAQLSFLLFPIVKITSDAFKDTGHVDRDGSTGRRFTILLAVLILLAAFLLYAPTNHKIVQQGIVLARQGEQIGAGIAGTVTEVSVKTGAWVEPGQIVARLRNPSIQAALETAEANVEIARVRLMALRSSRYFKDQTRIPGAASTFEAAMLALQRTHDKAAKLEVKASTAGYVLTPNLDQLVSRYVAEHHTLMRIGDLRELKIMIPLTEEQAQMTEIGSPVRGRWRTNAGKFETTIMTLPQKRAQLGEYLPGMMALYGGPAPFETNLDGSPAAEPSYPIFIAEANLSGVDHIRKEGMRVRVNIRGKQTTWAAKCWRGMLMLWKIRG